MPDNKESIKVETNDRNDRLPDIEHLVLEELLPAIQKIKQALFTDELTGVLNRKGIKEKFGELFDEVIKNRQITNYKRYLEARDLSVIFIDADNFKSINDQFGHEEGDRVLKEIAHAFNQGVRTKDLVGRLGGEEFVAVMLGASEEQAYKKAENLRQTIAKNIKRPDGSVVTASIGVASLEKTGVQTLDDLIQVADKAMYEAKTQRGKNNVVRASELK